MALLVSYDLVGGQARDYAGLHAELMKTGWWHHLESTWILDTSETPDQMYERLMPYLHEHDRVLVLSLPAGIGRQGWLPADGWTWIRRVLGAPR